MIKNLFKTILLTLGLCVGASIPALAGTYTVTSGDSLYNIGKLFNTSANQIMKDNNLKNITIYPGQTLTVPCDTYTVKKNDTLYLIAKKYSLPLNIMKKANNEWDNYIYPNQKLNLPTVNSSSSESSKPNVSYTQSDLDLLARLVTAEAQNQPYKAQVGVAAVVLNRVNSSTFPNSIKEVIYEKSHGYYQFTPVLNGWINKPATSTSIKAAKDALNGYDASNGALYYFDDSATNKWLWSKPQTAVVGNMVFAY